MSCQYVTGLASHVDDGLYACTWHLASARPRPRRWAAGPTDSPPSTEYTLHSRLIKKTTRTSRSCLQQGPVPGQGILIPEARPLSPPRRLPNQATTVSPCPFLPDARPSWRGGAADASRRRIGRGGHDTQPLAVALADPNPPTLLLGSSPRDSGLVSCCLGDGATGQRPRRQTEDGSLREEKARVSGSRRCKYRQPVSNNTSVDQLTCITAFQLRIK